MPQTRYECPACELVFLTTDKSDEEWISCPDCGAEIRAESRRSYGGSAPRLATQKSVSHVPVPTPQRVAARRRTPPPVNDKLAAENRSDKSNSTGRASEATLLKVARPAGSGEGRADESSKGSAPFLASDSSDGSSSKTSSAAKASASEMARKKSGSRIIVFLSTAGVATILLGLTGYMLFFKDGGILRASTADSDSDVSVNETSTADADTSEAADSAEPAIELLTEEQLATVWENINPNLVQIKAETSRGVILGSGVIIDSRGWIATSLQLVAGADSISVQLPSGEGDDGSISPQEINSRGILAYDVNHNLALISIPPDSFELKREIVLSIDPYPADGASLVVSGAPTEGRWLEPCAMTGKDTAVHEFYMSDMGAHAGIESELETNFILLSLASDQRFVGAPLLREDGVVAGILVGQNSDWPETRAVSVSHLRRLRDFAEDAPSSFKTAELTRLAETSTLESAHGNAGGDLGAQGNEARAPVVPGSVASRNEILTLQEVCSELSWNPQTATDYQAFIDLAHLLTAAEGVAADEAADEGTRLLLDESAQAVRKELSTSSWPNDDDIARINTFAIESMQENAEGVYCYAKVELPPGLAPEVNGNPTVMLSLIGTDQKVVLPVSQSFEELQSGSEWLIVGSRRQARTVVVENDGSPDLQAPVIFAMYVIERPEQIALLYPTTPTAIEHQVSRSF